VFAGAAREAVFSRPEVIRRVQAQFVPVALKAALVNNPPDDDEGRLYREIGRSKPAPQGICVVNSAGLVLDWALMFDDDQSVLDFLDRCLKRFARHPDAREPVTAERYMKFPSVRLDDVADSGRPLPLPLRHPGGKYCPGKPPVRPGTVVARLLGRALDGDGKPVADVVRQEHYVEDRFHLSIELQEQLAKALAAAEGRRFRLPDELARLLVGHAYLGQLDLNPLGGQGPGLKECVFWGRPVGEPGQGPARLWIEGRSEAAGASGSGEGGDGRLWEHEVRLTWEGWIVLDGQRVRRLLLLARGSEKLRWGNRRMALQGERDVARLPAGHPIDLACGAVYGIVGEPAAADEVAPDAPAERPQGPSPEEVRRQLVPILGPTFLIFRRKVQDELQLSAEQRQKLQDRLSVTVQDLRQFLQKLEGVAPEDREKELAAYRERAQEKLTAFLEGALKRDQLGRLGQLELQQHGLFALLRPDVAAELKLTDEQRRQLQAVMQELETRVRALFQKAQAEGNPADLGPQVMKLRREHERRLEGVLSDAQKQRWREMLGKPIDPGD
jgi:hypothetical protein